jgi:exonuclease-1
MKKTTDPDCHAKLRLEAVSNFQKGLSVTDQIERNAIAAMKRLGITVFVAPYEADAQLAYLCHIGICHAVLTEDSDIIVYSVISGTSFPILYKFNTTGSASLIDLNAFFVNNNSPDASDATGRRGKFLPNLRNFAGPAGRRLFVLMCILAGCDYCDSVNSIGLQTAQQVILLYMYRSIYNRGVTLAVRCRLY